MKTQTEMDRENLNAFKISLIGFGAQGSAEARNLKKSEVPFKLGLRENSSSAEKAKEEGFDVFSIPEALKGADIVLLNIPDQDQATFFEQYLRGAQPRYVVFAHGFSVHFKKIKLQDADPTAILIAPKGAASGLESLYGTPQALPAILAIEDPSEKSSPNESEKKWVESLARSLGCHSKALIWAQFKDETVCDLFSEQALLCGGVSELLKAAYETLTEAGYDKQTAYFETLFELKLIVDLIWKDGITGMRNRISPTARYGDLTRGNRVIDSHVKNQMKKVLSEIESGEFAEEFLSQIESTEFKEIRKNAESHPIEIIGKNLREQMAKS